jgi:integrase
LDTIGQWEGFTAKRVRDSKFDSRAARAKLKPSGKPYYTAIGQGLHLGYRKGATVGKWVVRRYVGDQDYKVETIAVADDVEDADGFHVLDFWQAQERARERGGRLLYTGPYRVRDAFDGYLKALGDRAEDTGRRVKNHILPALGDLHVEELGADRIRDWLNGMVRTGDDEAIRKSKCSANRTLTILKAGLNWAFKNTKHVASDAEWRKVAPFGRVAKARTRYLTLAEVERLLNACSPDFRKLVRGALETGARYGDLARLIVSDFNPDSGTVAIRNNKPDKAFHAILAPNGRQFFEQLTAGRSGAEPMFGKWWRESEQTRWMALAVERARIEPRITFHGLRHTWASLAVMAGMPLHVVARNLGHKDTKMVEKHYGHLAPGYVVDQIRQFAPDFGKVEPSNVTAIR